VIDLTRTPHPRRTVDVVSVVRVVDYVHYADGRARALHIVV